MYSRISISLFLFISIASYTSAASCDSNGQCKYGGSCGPDNRCSCPMRCSTWSISSETLYCQPRKGAMPEIFMNICFVLAKACELQEDIPLIKLDHKKPPSQWCLGTGGERNAKKWELCSRPEDFMGPCGGTLGQNGQANDAGICLKEKDSHRTRCECPQSRVGGSCEDKLVFLSASTDELDDGNSTDYKGVGIGASVGAGVLVGILVFAIIRRRRRSQALASRAGKRDQCGNDFSDEENYQNKSNRSESQQHGDNSSSNEQCAITICDRLTPVDTKEFAAPQCTPKRQRLNGVVVTDPISGDANNNKSGVSDTESGDTDTDMNIKSTPLLASYFTEKSDFTQGLSEHACTNKEAYTI